MFATKQFLALYRGWRKLIEIPIKERDKVAVYRGSTVTHTFVEVTSENETKKGQLSNMNQLKIECCLIIEAVKFFYSS